MSDTEFPLPPATFDFLTASLKMQAEVQLGLFYFGEGKDRPKPNFPLARHSIDMLAMLADTMMPEAFESAHDFAGLVTVAGFLAAFYLSKHAAK